MAVGACTVCVVAVDAEPLVEDVICLEFEPSAESHLVVTEVGVIMTNALDMAGPIMFGEHCESTVTSKCEACGTECVATLIYRYDDSGSVAVNSSVVAEGGVC